MLTANSNPHGSRKDLTDKAQEKITPESEKSVFDKAKEGVTDAGDKVASTVQPSETSTMSIVVQSTLGRLLIWDRR